jgi:type VI secretion system protein
MQGLRLLERLKDIERNPDNRGHWDAAVVTGSIMEHLLRILNTRQGSTQTADDFGLPDLTNLSASFSSDTFKELEQGIRDSILKYEPRLQDVRIDTVPVDEQNIVLRFNVSGRLDFAGKSLPISFETELDPDGRVEIFS